MSDEPTPQPMPQDRSGEAAVPSAAHADIEEFLEKWRGRWPEWRIAQTFVAAEQRLRAEAWFALLQELTDAAWGGTDPTPGVAKLGWWQDELRGWSKGARRHPLGIALHRVPAPWTALAAGLASLQAVRGDVLDGRTEAADTIAQRLRPCAEAIAACERELFAAADAPRQETKRLSAANIAADTDADTAAGTESVGANDADAADTALALLALQTLWTSADAARSEAGRMMPARAQRLLQMWASPARGRPRRVYDALIRRRLRSVARGAGLAPLSPWAALWVAWRAARH